MTSTELSLCLITSLALFILLKRSIFGRGGSIKIFCILFFLMGLPGLFLDLNEYYWGPVQLKNIITFIFFLLLTTIPWLTFDKWMKYKPSITVTDKGVDLLKKIFIIIIFASLISDLYIAPYAIRSYNMGAIEVRDNLSNISVLPNSLLTTISVTVGLLSPLYVLFVYLSLLDKRLHKYSFFLFISSFTYIVVSMPFMARDGYVVLPVIFVIYYLIFKDSLSNESLRKIKKYIGAVVILAAIFLAIFSFSRFYVKNGTGFDHDKLLGGTWGYLYQQPYVFDRTIKCQKDWHGVGLRFPILTLGAGDSSSVVRTQDFETMFGTMLSEFYSIGGYWSLIVFTLAFVLIYYVGLKMTIKRKNLFGIFVFFTVYLMLEVTGLFYFRYGGISNNYLFLLLTVLPLYLPKGIITFKK